MAEISTGTAPLPTSAARSRSKSMLSSVAVDATPAAARRKSMLSPPAAAAIATEKHAYCPADVVREIGEALYGREWLSPVGRDMELSHGLARLNAWSKATVSVPAWVVPRMLEVLATRQGVLQALWTRGFVTLPTEKHAYLAELGQALFGLRWQRPLAAAISAAQPDLFRSHGNRLGEERGRVDQHLHRTLGRMAAGTQPLKPAVWDAVRAELQHRLQLLEALEKKHA